MKLDAYLIRNGIRRGAFARIVGTTPSTVTRWCDGSRKPSPRQLRAIMRATNGKVSAVDFFDVSCRPGDWRCHVRAYAARHGLSMADVAAQIGVVSTSLSRWMMDGGPLPSLESASRICRLDPKNIKLEQFIDADTYAVPDRRASRKTARAIRSVA